MAKRSFGREWYASMTRSANSPGTSSTTTRPSMPSAKRSALPGPRAELGCLALERPEQLLEGGDTFALEHVGDVGHVDPDRRERVDRAVRAVEVGVDGTGQGAVVGDR